MEKKNIKEKLNEFAGNAVIPDVLSQVKAADFDSYKTDGSAIVPQSKQTPSRKKVFVRAALAMAAVLALVLTFAFVFAFDQTVYATINVCVTDTAEYTVTVNKKSQVIDISADNQEGKAVLQGFSYKKKDFEEALSALLKVCVDFWELTETQLSDDAITYSISCHDTEKAARLQDSANHCMGAAKQHCRNKNNHNQKCG